MNSLIRDKKKVKQVIDFTGVQNGKIHPSDIDAVMEFDNKVLILIEVKIKHVLIPIGQRILLERICDSWHIPEKAIILKVEHEFDDAEQDIVLRECTVTRTYYKGNWHTLKDPSNFIGFVNNLGMKWECKKCKF